MTKTLILMSAAASALALTCSSTALAQASSSVSQEEDAVARRVAQDTNSKALLDAERGRPRIAGYWKIERPMTALTTEAGKVPPLNAAGQALYKQRVAAGKRGRTEDPMSQCLPPGTPRVWLFDKPFMIAQAPAKITFFYQVNHIIRHVFLDGPLKLPDERDVLWEGNSSGRWEGDTLIIETGDFNGQQWLDDSGLPQSPDMRTTERIRRTGADSFENVITYEDAKYYSRPWTVRLTFKAQSRDLVLREENCTEKLLEVPLKEYAPN